MTTSPETFEARDPDAGVRVAALYEAHARTVLGLCRFLLRDPTEAEDAAQQSFLSAYRSLLGGAVPREPAAWLAAIARNECWSRIKLRMREPLALHEVPAPQADPLEIAARNADFAALRSGLEALSRPQREAFMLREFAGLSYSELALALGVSEPAVDSLLFRARTSLRRALAGVNSILVPIALRDQLARLIPGFDQPAMGTLAKLASLPVAAKLAAAGAGVALVVAGSTGIGRHAAPPAAATAPVPVRTLVAPRPAPVQAHLVRDVPKIVTAKAPLAVAPRPARMPVHSVPTVALPVQRLGLRSESPRPAQSAGDPAPSEPGGAPIVEPTDTGGPPPVAAPPSDPPTDPPTDSATSPPAAPPAAEPRTEKADSEPSSAEPPEPPQAAEAPEPPEPPEPTTAPGS